MKSILIAFGISLFVVTLLTLVIATVTWFFTLIYTHTWLWGIGGYILSVVVLALLIRKTVAHEFS